MVIINPDQTIAWANQTALTLHGIGSVDELGTIVCEYRQRFELRYQNRHKLPEGDYPMECLLAGEAFSEAVVEVARPGEDKHWMHQLRSLVLTDPKELPDCLESRPIEVLAATRRSVVLRSRRYFCMSDLFLLSETQLRRIQPYFALSHGIPRVDDRRVLSGIIFVIRNGLRWRDAPGDYGPSKTLCNRFIRWSRLGIFNRIFEALAHEGGKPDRVMIDATHLKAHRTAASLLKRAVPRRIGRTKGGLNAKLHAVCDGQGRPIVLLLSEGQVSDYKGAALMVAALPPAKQPIADRGYDGDWYREALQAKNIEPCIPGRKNRKVEPAYDARLYRQRHRIETMVARLKDGRHSRMGVVSQPATTAAPTPSCLPSSSQPPCYSGSMRPEARSILGRSRREYVVKQVLISPCQRASRTWRINLAMFVINSSGRSNAAKCPPRSYSVNWTRL